MLLTALHEAMRTVWALDLVGVTPTLWKGQIWRLRASLNCFSVFGMEHLLQGRNCQARDTSAGYPILSLFVARCIPLCPYRRIKLAVDIASQFSNNSKVPHQTTKRIPNTSHPPKAKNGLLAHKTDVRIFSFSCEVLPLPANPSAKGRTFGLSARMYVFLVGDRHGLTSPAHEHQMRLKY